MKLRNILIVIFITIYIPRVSSQTHDTTLAKQYFDRGLEFHRVESKYDSAANYFKKSAILFEKQKMWIKSVKSYGQCGWAYYYKQDISNSFLYIDKGIELGEYHFSDSTAEELNEMITLNRYKGVLYKHLNKYESALSYYNKSLQFNTRIKTIDSLNYLINSSKIHYAIGIVNLINRNKDLALVNFKKSLEIQKKLPFDPDFNIALIYINIGSVYRKYEDYKTAAIYYNQANHVITPQYNKYQGLKSFCINQLGAINYDNGNYIEAIKFIEKYIDISIKLFGNNHNQIARGYYNYALAYKNLGEIDSAIVYFKKADIIFSNNNGENSIEVADIDFQLGILHNTTKNYQQSIKYLEKALNIQLNLLGEKNYPISKTQYQLGNVYNNMKDYNMGIDYYQNAIISIVENFNDLNILHNPSINDISITKIDLLRPLQKKAALLHKLYLKNPDDTNMLTAALQTYELSFQLTDEIRKDYKSEDAKLVLSENIRPIYNEAIRVANELQNIKRGNYDSTIFNLMEAARSATLYSLIQEAKAIKFSGLPEPTIRKEKELKNDLNYFKTQIEKLKQQQNGIDTVILISYEQRYFELFIQLDSLHDRINNNYPIFNTIVSNTDRTSIREIQETIDKHSALLEYFIGDATLYIAVITSDSYNLQKVPIDSSLQQLSLKYYKNIKKGGSKKAFITLSNTLYTKLIEPIDEYISAKEKLIFIPNDYLNYIPFETLCKPSSTKTDDVNFSTLDYLIRDYEITYNHSATLWIKSNQKSKHNLLSKSNNEVFCAFAPIFSKANECDTSTIVGLQNSSQTEITGRSIDFDGMNFTELPYTKTEAENLAMLFNNKGFKTKIYLNQDASEDNFKNNIINFQYIHVATHGFSSDNPNLSGIAFSQLLHNSNVKYNNSSEYNLGNDGILYAGEMYSLTLNADLIVISACESGIGKLRTGEGLMAITRGLIYSGIPNIVISLWKVSDKHTNTMMISFYKEILADNSYSDSLRKAKLTMLENEKTSFPKLWSSFILNGQ